MPIFLSIWEKLGREQHRHRENQNPEIETYYSWSGWNTLIQLYLIPNISLDCLVIWVNFSSKTTLRVFFLLHTTEILLINIQPNHYICYLESTLESLLIQWIEWLLTLLLIVSPLPQLGHVFNLTRVVLKIYITLWAHKEKYFLISNTM